MSEETLEIIQPRPLISGEKGDQGRDLLKVTQTTRPETGLVQGSRLRIVSDASVIWRVNQGRVARVWHGAQKLPGSLPGA